MKNIGPFTYRGARLSHLIAQFCVTFAQFLRYLHIPASLDIHGGYKFCLEVKKRFCSHFAMTN
jgi:hypothetical protein